MEDIRHLIPFVEIVKCGSFASAAAKLGVTPPAVSKSVARLERRLGVRLFNRTTRRVHLTDEGQQLFTKLDALLSGIDAAIDDVREAVDEPTGKIRISVGATFGRYSLMPTLVEFMLQYPRVQLEVSFDDTPAGLIEQGFDVGIHHGYGSETSYVSRVLCEYPLILVASPAYLIRKGIPRTPAELAGHDCIGTITAAGIISNWWLEPVVRRGGKSNAGRRFTHVPNTRLSISKQWDINLTAALHGAGIAPTSLPAVLQFLKQKRLKIVLPGYRLHSPGGRGMGQIFILYPHREYLPLKTRTFVEFLLERFRADQNIAEDLSAFSA